MLDELEVDMRQMIVEMGASEEARLRGRWIAMSEPETASRVADGAGDASAAGSVPEPRTRPYDLDVDLDVEPLDPDQNSYVD